MKMKAIFFVVILIIMVTMVNSNVENGTKFSIVDLRAFLYFHSTGAVSSINLADGKDHALWNTPIGEGEAGQPSQAVWMLIDIVGPSFSEDSGAILHVTAINGGKTLLDQTQILYDWYCRSNKNIIPFLVYGTGCGDLEISARLDGLPDEKVDNSVLKRTIHFKCGE